MIVTVVDGAQVLDERDCRSVALRDGRPAVVWRGIAYPLIEGRLAIDIAGEGFPPAETRFPAPESRPASPCRFLPAHEGAYVLVEGSVVDAEAEARRLRMAGFSVLRVGRYLGEPIDGAAPDWFVRVSATGADLESLERLAAALPPSGTPAAGEGLRERLIAGALAAERSRSDLLRTDLTAALSGLDAARRAADEAVRARADAEAAALDALTRLAGMEEAVQTLPAAAVPQPTPPELPPLSAPPPGTPPRQVVRLKAEVESMCAALLPRIRFLRDSLDTVAMEFQTRTMLYRALEELQSSDKGIPTANWKYLKGADAWIERHVSTGEADTGRLYARLDRTDRRWDVLVGFKIEQPRDLAWLKAR